MEVEEEGSPSLLASSPRRVDLDVVCRVVYFCKFCGRFARQPVLNVICGHLFCWCCLYRDVKRRCREGRRPCCPLCYSHLDIFPTTSTIIRVSSGPQPGVVACPEGVDEIINHEHPGRGKEMEKKLKVKGVPPRPWFQDASKYPSLSAYMRVLFLTLQSSPMDIGEWCDIICDKETGEPESFVELIEEEIPKMIQVVENHKLWLKGEESSEVPRAMIKKNKKIAVGQKKRIPFGKAKLAWRLHIKLRLSSQFFYNRMPGKTTKLKHKLLLHQIEDFSHGLELFSCTICSKPAYEPVVINTGHLFCWTCLRGQDNFACVLCPATKISISAVSSCTPASSIYFTCNDHEEEDNLLVTNRLTKVSLNRNCNGDVTKLPSRPNPTMVTQFLEYMIFVIKEEGDVILKLLSEIIPNLNDDRQKVENICGEIRGRVDALFAWLVTAWCVHCKEQESEARFGLKKMIDFIDKDGCYYTAWERLVMKMDQRIFPGGQKVH